MSATLFCFATGRMAMGAAVTGDHAGESPQTLNVRTQRPAERAQ